MKKTSKRATEAGPVVEHFRCRPGMGWEQRCLICGGRHTSGYNVSDRSGTRFYCDAHSKTEVRSWPSGTRSWPAHRAAAGAPRAGSGWREDGAAFCLLHAKGASSGTLIGPKERAFVRAAGIRCALCGRLLVP